MAVRLDDGSTTVPTPEEFVREVQEATRQAFGDFTRDEQAFLRDWSVAVPETVRLLDGERLPEYPWAVTLWESRVIEVYRTVIPDFPDPAIRRIQLRAIMRHEFDHALMRNLDEYAPRIDVGPDDWVSHMPVTVVSHGLTVTLPEPIP